MAICDVVVTLAKAIRETCEVTSPIQDLIIYEIQAMRLYRDIRRLDIWDTATRPLLVLLDENQSPIGEVLRDLIEFGALNLYGAVDEGETITEYQVLARKFNNLGIPTPSNVDLSDW